MKLDQKKTIMLSEEMAVRMDLAVEEKRKSTIYDYTISDFIREAIDEKLKREFNI